MLFHSKRLGAAGVAFVLLIALLTGCGGPTSSSGVGCPAFGCGPCPLPALPCVAPSPAMAVIDFGGLTTAAKPNALALGPDGNMWFTETIGRIGRIAPNGQVAEFVEPIPNQPSGIVAAIDGNLWAAGVNGIDRVTTSGAFTQFVYPTANAGGGDITNGPDGRLWFAETLAGKIGAITTNGAITEYSVGTNASLPVPVVLDPARNGVWYALFGSNTIGLIGPTGTILSSFTVPTPNSGPLGMVAGADGALWFVEYNAGKIGRMTTSGQFSEYSLAAGAQPNDITAGADGNLWFVEFGANKIGRITTAGVISEFPTPTASAGPVAIRPGAGRSLWFAENTAARIGEVLNP